MAMTSSVRVPLLTLLAIFLTVRMSTAKIQISEIQMSSEECDQYLAKFSFDAGASGVISGKFYSADRHYFDGRPHNLQVALYSQDEWDKYQDILAKGSLCTERLALPSYTKRIHPNNSRRKSAASAYSPEFQFSWELDIKDQSHYWYLVLADCHLENYPAHPPKVKYELSFLNAGSHLPSDETGLPTVHLIVLVLLVLGAVAYTVQLRKLYMKAERIHLSGLLLGLAHGTQLLSTAMELMHLRRYAADGVGSPWMDFMSDALLNLSELMISVLLVAISLGWTLHATDMGGVRGGAVVMLSLAIAVIQVVLEYKGQQYEEAYYSFHDHEHWPGKALMLLRVALCGILWIGVVTTTRRLKSSQAESDSKNTAVINFLKKLGYVGTFWLLSFPFVVLFVAPLVKPERRHLLVTSMSILLQCGGLLALGVMLLSGDGEYFRISSLSMIGPVFGTGASGGSYSAGAGMGRRLLNKFRKKVAVD